MSVSFTDYGATIWMSVDFERVLGRGTIVPSIVLELNGKTSSEAFQVELHHLRGKLYFNSEYLGYGAVGFKPISSRGTNLELQIPMNPAAFGFINENLRDADIGMSLSFDGLMRVRQDESAARYPTSPPAGVWTFIGIGLNRLTELKFQVSRSDWFKNVMEPIALDRYVFTEVRIPTGVLRDRFRAAADSLLRAESHFINGNDPEVFFQCRAALESLTGAPKNIFDAIGDELKRQEVNDLVKQLVTFLHSGRHAKPDRGFLVNHLDAELGLSLTKVVLAYISKASG